MFSDTIFAPATAVVKSSTAIIRISGNNSLDALSCFSVEEHKVKVGSINLCKIYDENKNILDNVIILRFQSPKSLTGEDVIEIQCHGSIPIINKILQMLGKIKNFRFAKNGEFLQRALINQKITLNQLEGLSDMFDSETEEQIKQAALQTFGDSHNRIMEINNELIEINSTLCALLDFAEYETEANEKKIKDLSKNIINKISECINGFSFNERIRNGFRVVLIGKTNSGKSTLINTLSNRNLAIVSDIHGTTRDSIESIVNIDGYPIIITDTAGIRKIKENQIEEIGICKSISLAKNSDILIVLNDNIENIINQNEELAEILFEIKKENRNCTIVNTISKADNCKNNERITINGNEYLLFSCKENKNIEILKNEITKAIKDKFVKSKCCISRNRHKIALKKVMAHLENLLNCDDLEIMCEIGRSALNEMGQITGETTFEEILDDVFSQFCIGK